MNVDSQDEKLALTALRVVRAHITSLRINERASSYDFVAATYATRDLLKTCELSESVREEVDLTTDVATDNFIEAARLLDKRRPFYVAAFWRRVLVALVACLYLAVAVALIWTENVVVIVALVAVAAFEFRTLGDSFILKTCVDALVKIFKKFSS